MIIDPSHMSWRSIWRLVKETVDERQRDRVDQMAAALAYYTLFSIAPLLYFARAKPALLPSIICRVREEASPLSPPLRTVLETFALTRLKPYFKLENLDLECTCLWHAVCKCCRLLMSSKPPWATGTIWWVSMDSPFSNGSPQIGHFQFWFCANR